MIEPHRYEVASITTDTEARAFVIEHHYSGAYPAARRRVGLAQGAALVGVAVFSVPAQARALDVLPCDRAEAVELGRLVLLDGVRTLGSLSKLMAAHELHTLARELKDSGFISVETLPAEPNTVATKPPAVTGTEKPAAAEESLDPVRLTRAKAYLIEISQLHLGLLAAKLQQEIAEAGDAASLRAALAHWNMALRESRTGAAIAGPCLQQAREILGWPR